MSEEKSEVEEYAEWIRNLQSAQTASTLLMGEVCMNLFRLARGVEAMVEMGKLDIESLIQEEIESRAESRANEMINDKTKRSIIGR